MVQLMMARYTPPETVREYNFTERPTYDYELDEFDDNDIDRLAGNGDMEAVLWMTHPPLLYDYNTTFENACIKEQLVMAQLLIDYLIGRHEEIENGQMPWFGFWVLNDVLGDAARKGSVEIVELILKDPRTNTNIAREDYNPFIQACLNNRISVVKMLLEDRMAHITHFLVTNAYFSFNLKNCYEECVEKGFTDILELLRNDQRIKYDPNATEPDYNIDLSEPDYNSDLS